MSHQRLSIHALFNEAQAPCTCMLQTAHACLQNIGAAYDKLGCSLTAYHSAALRHKLSKMAGHLALPAQNSMLSNQVSRLCKQREKDLISGLCF